MTEFSRRDFLRRATQAGAAFAVAAPSLELLLRASASAATLDAADAATLARYADPQRLQQLAALGNGLQWRLLGPFRGGRVDAVSGVVGRPNEFYFGAVNGGVWKSIDAGRVWEPVFDAMPIASIGALAVAPSAPDVVYAGSGESTLRDSASFGNGMYKSVDAGKSWTHIGLDGTQHIGKIAVHPTNPNVVYVAAIGHQYAANPERGVFRTTDGGRSWKKVLFHNDDVGAVEVVIDPSNPRVIYAGLWNTRRPPWFIYAPTNGPGGGIWKSTDGGDTWKQLTSGLPPEGTGRIGIAVAPSNPRRVYAVVDCLLPEPNAPAPAPAANGRQAPVPMQGGVFRSDDAGATWRRLSNDPALWGRGWYFEKIAVDPKDADVVYVPNVAVNRTRDGGKTWDVIRGSPGGDDYHQIWIDPNDTNTLIVASDQGAVITHNAKGPAGAVTWSSWLNQPTAQLYHISVDYRFPYWVTGAQQDTGAVAVRYRGKFGEISMRDWEPSGAGGESGYTAGDPLHPGIIYGGMGNRHDLATNTPIPGTTSPQAPSAEEHLRADWTQPLVLSQADPHALYYGAQFLFRSNDEARTWTRISPDLTREKPGVPANLDAAAAADFDPAGNGQRGVIYTIAPSPISAPMLWIGTDDGNIQRTTNDGASWENVTPSQITPWSRVTMIEASHFDPNVAYASVDRHQLQDFKPYVYRTRDGGRSWQLITRGLPAEGYAHTVKEDPKRKGFLVAGTELGAFASMDDGDSWQPLQFNLPVTSVRDFQFYNDDLIVGTFGRGIWVIDDISPLRQLDANVLASDVYLFKPADAINYVQGGDEGTPFQKDEAQAENPADGAYLYYYLKNAASGPVTIEIMDASGKTIATESSDPNAMASGRRRRGGNSGGIPNVSPLWQTTPQPLSTAAGIHRAVWEPIASVTPGGDGFRRTTTRLTGTFTAKLTANGKSYTQTFTVKPDPRAAS
jgi:photosystem II stability/assembly factor-like uncharacterized protein